MGQVWDITGLPPLPAISVGTAVLFKASQPSLLGSAMMGSQEARCLFQEESASAPLTVPVHSVRTAAELLYHNHAH